MQRYVQCIYLSIPAYMFSLSFFLCICFVSPSASICLSLYIALCLSIVRYLSRPSLHLTLFVSFFCVCRSSVLYLCLAVWSFSFCVYLPVSFCFSLVRYLIVLSVFVSFVMCLFGFTCCSASLRPFFRLLFLSGCMLIVSFVCPFVIDFVLSVCVVMYVVML